MDLWTTHSLKILRLIATRASALSGITRGQALSSLLQQLSVKLWCHNSKLVITRLVNSWAFPAQWNLYLCFFLFSFLFSIIIVFTVFISYWNIVVFQQNKTKNKSYKLYVITKVSNEIKYFYFLNVNPKDCIKQGGEWMVVYTSEGGSRPS